MLAAARLNVSLLTKSVEIAQTMIVINLSMKAVNVPMQITMGAATKSILSVTPMVSHWSAGRRDLSVKMARCLKCWPAVIRTAAFHGNNAESHNA